MLVLRLLKKKTIPFKKGYLNPGRNKIFLNVIPTEPNIIETVSSPNGKYIAYVYEKNGGATTGFIYHLSILEKDTSLKRRKGNVYISEYEFKIQWINDDILYVDNTSSKNIGKQKVSFLDVKIEYNYYK